MNCRLKCDDCGAEAWHTGEDDPETNGFSVNDDRSIEWDGGKSECPHHNFSVVETEPQDDPDYQDYL